MEQDESEIPRKAIFEVIENQMRDNTPPITKETYTRLRSEGYSHEEIMKNIGCALSVETLKNKQVFNEQRYTNNLTALPELPWEDE